MDREQLIDAIAKVLGAHDCADYATWCICGKKLYTGDVNQSATSMRRHRAEKILETLETMEAKWVT
jgi:hypothetical protein